MKILACALASIVCVSCTVTTRELAIADASGVAFIPAADIERVLDAAELIAGREAAMAKALLAGTPIPDVMGADYEHMLR